MAFKQEVNVPLVVTIGVVSGLLVLVIVIGMQAWFQSEERNEMAIEATEAYERPGNWLKNLQHEQEETINAKVHWVSQEDGLVAIPIQQAMDYLAGHDGKLPSTQPASSGS